MGLAHKQPSSQMPLAFKQISQQQLNLSSLSLASSSAPKPKPPKPQSSSHLGLLKITAQSTKTNLVRKSYVRREVESS